MIVTSAIVITIVICGFAFKTKVKTWCVNRNGSANCTMITGGMKIVPPGWGLQFKYYPEWDGDGTKCFFSNNGLCTATFNLDTD